MLRCQKLRIKFSNNYFYLLSEILNDIRKARHRHGGTPTDADLQGAAKALNRLQQIYKLDLNQFVKGNIMGVQTAAQLTVKDTFYLGR